MDGEVGERVDEMTSWFLFAGNESPGSSCSHPDPSFLCGLRPQLGKGETCPYTLTAGPGKWLTLFSQLVAGAPAVIPYLNPFSMIFASG